jgi:hypothetical protein
MANKFLKAILVVSAVFSFFFSASARSDIVTDARDAVEDFIHTWLPPENYSDILKEADQTRSSWQSPAARPSQPLQIFLHQAMYAYGGQMAHYMSEALNDFTPDQREDQDYRLKAVSAAVALSAVATEPQNYHDTQFALYLMIYSRFPKVRLEAVKAIEVLPLTLDKNGEVSDIHNYLKMYLTFMDKRVRAALRNIVEKYHSPERIAYMEQETRVSKLAIANEFLHACKDALQNIFRYITSH